MWILLTALRSFARSGPLQTGHSTLTFSLLLMSPFTPAACIQHYQDAECELEPRPVIISFTQQTWTRVTLCLLKGLTHTCKQCWTMLIIGILVQKDLHQKLVLRIFAEGQILYPHWLSNIACMSCLDLSLGGSDTYFKWKLRLKLNKV